MEEEKQKEQQATLGNVEEIKAPEVTKHELFNIVKGQKGYFLAIGNKIVSSRTFKSLDGAKRYINSKPWELLINASCICFEIMNQK